MKNFFARNEALPYIIFFSLLGVGLSGLILGTRSTTIPGAMPYTLMDQDLLRGVLAAITALLLAICAVFFRGSPFERKGRIAGAISLLFVLLTASGGTLYFYTHRGLTIRDYLNFHDLYHYFLGCKYYPEADYNELYACHLVADQEQKEHHFRNRDRVRDLRTYELVPVPEAREYANCANFTEDRWREFEKDTAFFSDHLSPGVLQDHGYNGTPFSAAIAGFIANLPEVTYTNLVRLTLLDLLGLCFLFAFVTWGFGPTAGILAALFQFVNFGDYYYHVSFFRYFWLITLGAGLTLLYKKRFGAAAVLMVASAMLNVFPVLFLTAFGAKIVFSIISKRTLIREYRRFVAWAAISVVLFGAVSMTHDHVLDRYASFFSKMDLHSSLMTTTRTGFRFNFAYRPPFENTPGPAGHVVRQLQGLYKNTTAVRTLQTAFLLLLFALLVVKLDDLDAALFGGCMLLFLLFSTVVYYYAFLSLLPLLWVKDLDKPKGMWMTALLFALMAMVYLAWGLTESRAFTNNTVLSGIITLYLAIIFIVKALSVRVFEVSFLKSE